MPSVSGLGLTFNLPNYTGEVLQVTPSETPFLTAIGGLNEQGEVVMSTEFEGETQDLGTPSQPDVLEGADAPSLENRSRAKWDNVVQIFHRAYGVSYTRQAATQLLAGLANGRMNPVTDEIAYQDQIHLTEVARDINWTFINGVYQKPSDNSTSRKTRGLLAAISSNALDNRETAIAVAGEADDETFTATGHGLANGDQVVFSSLSSGSAGISASTTYYVIAAAANTFKVSLTRGGSTVALSADITANVQRLTPLTKVRALDLIQLIWDSHGVSADLEPTLMVNAPLKRALTKLFITDANYQEQSRNVAGVAVTQIETDFGRINIMLERAMPKTSLAFTHLRLCKPAYLLIPGKGFLFTEELAKTGAQEKRQLYGEVGFWHGPEQAHGKIAYVGEIASA